MDEQTTQMSLPLDNDGFLRRECPTCEREFKWFNSEEGDGEPVPDAGYYCPYCAIQAPPGSWFTPAQIELARNTVMRDVVRPELEKFGRDLRRSTRGGFLKLDVTVNTPDAMDPLLETNDMRRVDFACHPEEPVKVLDEWDRDVHCMICSTAAGTP